MLTGVGRQSVKLTGMSAPTVEDNFLGVTQIRVETWWIEITKRKVTDIPVNNLVIRAVGNMAAENKITTLKFKKSQECYYIPIIVWQGWIMKIKMQTKAKI